MKPAFYFYESEVITVIEDRNFWNYYIYQRTWIISEQSRCLNYNSFKAAERKLYIYADVIHSHYDFAAKTAIYKIQRLNKLALTLKCRVIQKEHVYN